MWFVIAISLMCFIKGGMPENEITDIRLVGGTNSLKGRLEVKYNGIWGTVCDDWFTSVDARVACAQLNLTNPVATAWPKAYFGAGLGRINLHLVACYGNETSLNQCKKRLYPNTNCYHSEDVGVDCEFSLDPPAVFVRLVGGSTAHEGTVEVSYRGVVGTICDNNWDDNDAEVICSMLGYTRIGSKAAARGEFGQGQGITWVDEVNCNGTERLIADCPTTNNWLAHTCSHEEDAGVICSTEANLNNFILVTDSEHGKIYRMDLSTFSQTEIPHDDHHQPMAIGYDNVRQDVYWSDLASRQLKKSDLDGSNFEIIMDLVPYAEPFGLAIDPLSRNLYLIDAGTNAISVINLETTVSSTIFRGLDPDEPRAIALHPARGYIFWTSMGNYNSKIHRANMDGTDHVSLIRDWDVYSPTGIAIDYSAERIYWAETFSRTIEKADFKGDNRETYVGFDYTDIYGLVLVGDYIYYTDWDASSVKKVNKNGENKASVGPSGHGRLNEITVYMSNQGIYNIPPNNCTADIDGCSHICVPMPDSAIACLCPDNMELDGDGKTCILRDDLSIRLVGGADPLEERLEVKYNDVWGTVSHDYFDDNAAKVICKQLGHSNPAATAWRGAYFGEGSGRVNLDNLICDGTETSLNECSAKYYPNTGFSRHYEDVGVDCDFSPDPSTVFVALMGGSTPNEGTVAVIYRNEIGTICDHDWDDDDAKVICSMLGYKRIGSKAAAKGAFGRVYGRIWVDGVNCNRTESLIYDCPTTNGWIAHTCSDEVNFAAVICSTDSPLDNFILVTISIPYPHIYRIDLSTFAQTEIPHDKRGPEAIEYDHISQKMYWIDDWSNELKKSNLDGSDAEILANLGYSLAIDPISRNIFFTDREARTISVGNLDSFAAISIIEDLNQPRGIAVHPTRRYIFWTDSDTKTIERADMDGTSRITLINSEISRPDGIAIDYSADMIYWVDNGRGSKIEKADFDGLKRETIHLGSGDISGLVLIDDYIFYTDEYERFLMRMNTTGEGNMRVGPGRFGSINGITAYRSGEGISTLVANGCSINRGGCSHTCVPMPDDAITCLCPYYMVLVGDGKTCAPENLTDIRLVGGTTPKEGRLEVKYGDIWGTVCNMYDFDDGDARVACAQLNYTNPAAIFLGNAWTYFSEGTGRIHIGNVNCTGTETSLDDCMIRKYPYHDCTRHFTDVGVDCDFPPGASGLSARLVGGSTPNQGRVELLYGHERKELLELYYEKERGTICDNNWDDDDAKVICSMIGYQRAGSHAATKGEFGEGDGRIWVDEVNCDGNESSIADCPTTNGWIIHACSHEDDAGVICSTENQISDIRLVDGTDALEGRLEVKYLLDWGTVCDDKFDDVDARVVCAQLNHPNPAATAWHRASFREGTGRINLNYVKCNGTEASIDKCESKRFPGHNCRHNEDAGVDCDFSPESSSVFVRLVGGSTANEGRVQVIYRNVVGTICDNNWDDNDAKVICSMLGYQRAGSQASTNDTFGHRYGRIWVDDVNCNGTEALIYDCPTTNGWIVHTCSYTDNKAGVICSTDSSPDNFILVTDPDHDRIYRMDLSTFAQTVIPHNGHRWTTEIGYDHVAQEVYWYDQSSRQLKKSNLDGSNFKIFARSVSRSDGIALHPARGYIFWTDWRRNTIERANMDGTGHLTLIDSELARPRGIVLDYSADMIYWVDDSRGTIGKADFNGLNRETVYAGTKSFSRFVLVDDYIYYFSGNFMRINKNEGNTTVVPITIDAYGITAYKSNEGIHTLVENECSQNRGGCSHTCVPMPDEVIVCLCPDNMVLAGDGKTCLRDQIFDIQLVSGNDSLEGRLEVKYRDILGTVCDDSFEDEDARVVCAELNHPNPAATAWPSAVFGQGTGPIILDDVECDGTESAIDECESKRYPAHNCQHHEDVGVDCEFSPEPSTVFVRLVGGPTSNQGRIEVIYRNVVGTICGNNWDDNDAMVICSMLGYQRAGSQASAKGKFGQGDGRIWVDEVNCNGTEVLIYDCPTTNGWIVHTCSHEDDVGVICSTESPPDNFILVTDSDHDSIYRMDLSTFAQTEIVHNGNRRPTAIGYDHVTQEVYWSDVSSKQLKKSNLDGSNFEILIDLQKGSSPDGLAIDPISRNLYFTDAGAKTIRVTNLEVFGLITIVTDLDNPRGIALHPSRGYIFWTDWGTGNKKIARSNMDGTGGIVLISSELGWPNGITIDYSANMIYWADAYTDKIEKADFSGLNRTTIHTGTGHISGLVMLKQYIYYTDWRENSVVRISTNGKNKTEIGPPTFRRMNGITGYTFDDGIYTLVANGCSEKRGGCSHTCVPLPDDAIRCLCPDRMKLDGIGKTCVGA